MRYKYYCLMLSGLLFSIIAQAHIKPVVTLSFGADSFNVKPSNAALVFSSPDSSVSLQNSYVSTKLSDTEAVGGVFLGAEFPVNSVLHLQLGASYYNDVDGAQMRGDIYHSVVGMPPLSSMANAYYTYEVQSQRVLFESKLLWMMKSQFHPYVDIGLGEAFNHSKNYMETSYPYDGGSSFPMNPGLGNDSVDSFTYMAGLGIDVDLGRLVRLGVGYRYVDLGQSRLSTTPIEQGATTLKNNSLTSNEFLVQLSTVC